jgi:hypothetical protein
MKRLTLNLSMFALVLGITSALAFKAPEKKLTTYYWFDTNAAGVPTTYDAQGPQCSDDIGAYCSKEYADSQINFSGGVPVSVKTGQEDLQHASEQKGE